MHLARLRWIFVGIASSRVHEGRDAQPIGHPKGPWRGRDQGVTSTSSSTHVGYCAVGIQATPKIPMGGISKSTLTEPSCHRYRLPTKGFPVDGGSRRNSIRAWTPVGISSFEASAVDGAGSFETMLRATRFASPESRSARVLPDVLPAPGGW